MNNKIILVDPRGSYGYEFKLSSPKIREPLGLEYIASIIKREGYDLGILMQTEPYDQFLQRIISYNAMIVGFSCMSYNINTGLSIAKKLKEKNPKTITIFGGEHPLLIFL